MELPAEITMLRILGCLTDRSTQPHSTVKHVVGTDDRHPDGRLC